MHPEIMQDKPGNCPKCGMNLVPVKDEAHKSVSLHQETGNNPPMGHAGHKHGEMVSADLNKGSTSFKKYTCPMHPHIVQDGPGKCPLCGMTLVPLAKSGAHDGHKSHSSGIADFRRRFFVVLILTIPIMLLSEMIQHWLNIHISFPGSKYILLALSSVVFFYGGWPFLKGLVSEVR